MRLLLDVTQWTPCIYLYIYLSIAYSGIKEYLIVNLTRVKWEREREREGEREKEWEGGRELNVEFCFVQGFEGFIIIQ